MSSEPSAPSDRRPRLRVLHHLARTGGTLISRCLGSMKGVALLSEVHPFGGNFVNPLAQAQSWYGLFDDAECRRLAQAGPITFVDAIAAIDQGARRRGLSLVVRDWAHMDYTGVPWISDLTFRLRTAEALTERFDLVRTATVRHPLDSWLSLSAQAIMRGKLDLDRYMEGCRRFAETAVELGFVRYEDVCAEPATAIRSLCQRLELTYDPAFLEHHAEWTRVTGDVGPSVDTRGGGAVRQIPRRAVATELLLRLDRQPDYRRTLDLLGYDHPQPVRSAA